MFPKQSISPLLQSVITDNPTYKFPIEFINKELVSLFLEPLEFDYFIIQAYRKLKREFGHTIAHIFLQLVDMKLLSQHTHIHNLPLSDYQSELEKFLNALENVYITKVDKKSPDGEMMSAMI